MSSQPSYEEPAALVASQAGVIDVLRTELAEVRAENAELRRRLGMDSSNSSTPSSQDPPARKVTRSQRVRSTDRKPSGQSGRVGRSLAPVAVPDRSERIEPVDCADCHQRLEGAVQEGTG